MIRTTGLTEEQIANTKKRKEIALRGNGMSNKEIVLANSLSDFQKELLKMIPTVRLYNYMFDVPIDKSKKTARNGGFVAYKPQKHCVIFTVGMPSITHEIAHFVEMNDMSRLLKYDFGMANEPNSFFKKPAEFFASIARECRAVAIQSHMDKERTSFDNMTWTHNGARPHIPFGRFKNHQIFLDWIQTMFQDTRARWSLDRIRHEWIRRVEYVRNWQETTE